MSNLAFRKQHIPIRVQWKSTISMISSFYCCRKCKGHVYHFFFSFKNSASNVLDTNQFSCFPSSIWFIHDLYYQPEKLYHFSGFFLISFKDGFLHSIWTLFLFVWLTWWCWTVAISVVSQLMIPFSSKILHFSPYLLLGIACF